MPSSTLKKLQSADSPSELAVKRVVDDAARPLRIAMMIESDGPGGAEMMVFRLAQELRRRGHSVVPVGPRNGTGWMGRLFREAGVPQETYSLKRPIDPGCVRRLTRLVREHSIDIVHSHEFTMAVYGAAAAMLAGIPHVMTVHGGFTATAALRRRIALRWAMRRSGHAIAVSNATRAEFAQKLGVRSSVFDVVHNGVPSKRGSGKPIAEEFKIGDGEVVLLAVGNLERNKNHRMLLEAMVDLLQAGLNVPWRLIIAAGRGGPEQEYLADYVQTHRLENHVHIVLGRSDVADLLARADLFVMPSIWEGLPMALLEAMVAGKAIIASATAGIPEAIASGAEGILVPPGDLDALKTALRDLVTNADRRRALGAAAGARAAREFTIEVMTDRYLAMYQPLVARRAVWR